MRYMLTSQQQEAALDMSDVELLRFAKSSGLTANMAPADRYTTCLQLSLVTHRLLFRL